MKDEVSIQMKNKKFESIVKEDIDNSFVCVEMKICACGFKQGGV